MKKTTKNNLPWSTSAKDYAEHFASQSKAEITDEEIDEIAEKATVKICEIISKILKEQLADKDSRIEKLEELVKLKNEYRDFCKKEYDTLVILAYVHGWRADKKDIAKGKQYRKKIAELEKQLNN